MRLHIRTAMPLCILFGCCFFSSKSYAFDYDKYNKDHKQLRAIKSGTLVQGETKQSKMSKSKAFERFASQVLEAMDNDAIPTKIFDTGTNISFYFKPAKITKLGIRYKF